MLKKKRRKPLFLKIQRLAVGDLLAKSDTKLKEIEQILFDESRQAILAHRWVQGVIRLKKSLEDRA
ncbi:MAG: hypothetical protein ACK5N8_04660 [Alphaproteobacteria bacterium]